MNTISVRLIAATQKPTNVSNIYWTLWSVAISIAWLLPTHSAPWTTFYQEILVGATFIPIGIWASSQRDGTWEFDGTSVCFFLAGTIPFIQAWAGMFSFREEAGLVALYLTGLALTVQLARYVENRNPGSLVDALFAGLTIAALLSTGIALYQWLGLDWIGVLIAPNPMTDRPVANVGAPNNLATLIVWGLVAVWWTHWHKRIGATVALLAAAFLLTGVALTQSRTGVLEVCLLAVTALFARRKLQTSSQWVAWVSLAIWFSTCLLALQPLTKLLLQQSTRSLVDSGSPQERLMLLKMVLAAIAEHPWIGYGWNQNVTAHVELAARFPMHGTVGNAHNLLLDLIIWNGLPIAALIIFGIFIWCWRTIKAAITAEQILLLVALGTFLTHAMLELPHVFACFLLPAVVFVGALNARRGTTGVVVVPRSIVLLATIFFAGTLLLMFMEYGRIEETATSARMRSAGIVNAPADIDPGVFVLSSLQDGLNTLRTEPRRNMTTEQLEHWRHAVTRYPTRAGLFRYAEAAALNNQRDEASRALLVLCNLHIPDACLDAERGWKYLTQNQYSELATIIVPW